MRFLRRAFLLVTLLLAESAFLSAQTPESAQESVRFEHLTNRDGLSQMGVLAIAQDQRGFLWIGTGEGLNRFDGYTFKIFRHDPEDTNSLLHNQVDLLTTDSNGHLWIATLAGLHHFDPISEQFVRYRHDPDRPESLSHDRVNAVLEDTDGTVWIATDAGLDRFDPLSQRFLPDRRIQRAQLHPAVTDTPRPATETPQAEADTSDMTESPRPVFDLLQDQSGELWAVTQERVYRLSPDGVGVTSYPHRSTAPNTTYTGLSTDFIPSLLEDRSGVLWLGTSSGLDRFDAVAEQFVPQFDEPAFNLLEDRQNRLWFSSSDGLHRFDTARRKLRDFRRDPEDPQSLAWNDVRALFEDRSGILWIGTYGRGIDRIDPSRGRFEHIGRDPSTNDGLSSPYVRTFLKDRRGRLWVGTEKGLDRRDGPHEEFIHYHHSPTDPRSLPQDRVYSMIEDRQGRVWVATADGAGIFDENDGGFQTFRHDPESPESLSDQHIRVLYQDRAGSFWFGTRNGLNRLDDPSTQKFIRYLHDPDDPSSLSAHYIWDLQEDRAGHLWIGTRSGLNRLDPSRTEIRRFYHSPEDPRSLSHDNAWTLLESRDGVLWVGTEGGGLNRFDPSSETFTRFSHRYETINALLEDSLGRLWLSTNDGLLRFDPQRETWASFDYLDGLQDNEFTFGAAFQETDGTMYFGGINGYNSFLPELFLDTDTPTSLALTSFRIFGQESVLLQEAVRNRQIDLEHWQNFFSLEFASLSFTRPDKNRYAYRLEGIDEDWVDAGERRLAGYTAVSPGEYVFRVKASNREGIWNDTETTLKMNILPPWWRSGWAFFGYVLLLLTTVFSYVYLQRRKIRNERNMNKTLIRLLAQVEARNRELGQINAVISHDLKNPLVTILNFTGLMREDARRGETQKLEDHLKRLEGAAKTMNRLLDDLFAYSGRKQRRRRPRKQVVSLNEIVAEAVDHLSDLSEEYQVEIVVEDDLPNAVGYRAELLLAVQCLLENALKFCAEQEAPKVEIGIHTASSASASNSDPKNPQAILQIRDNGIGVDPRYQRKIFGLFQKLGHEYEGTGLGLALSAQIAEAHGGKLWVESAGKGQGSTFFLSLPVSSEEV